MLKGDRKKLRKISTATASSARKRMVSTASSFADIGAGAGGAEAGAAEFLAVALARVMPRIGDEWTRRSSEYRRTTLAWAPPLAYGESHIRSRSHRAETKRTSDGHRHRSLAGPRRL